MKKKVIIAINFLIFLLFLFSNCSYGFTKTFAIKPVIINNLEEDQTVEDIRKILSETLGYQGDKLLKEMKIATYVKVSNYDSKKKKYTIQFGETGCDVETCNFDNLKSRWGLDEKVKEEDIKKGYTWNANIIVEYKDKLLSKPQISLVKLFTGEDLDKIKDERVNNKEAKKSISEKVDNAKSYLDGIVKFCKNPVGMIAKKFMEILCGLGDVFQWLANLVQSIPDKTYKDVKLLYSYEELKADGEQSDEGSNSEDVDDDGEGNRDKYTKVGEYKSGEAVIGRIEVSADKNGNDEKDFTAETKIPVITGDLYNIAVGNIDFIDINFLTGNKTKKADGKGLRHGEMWINFRNFASALIRMSVYITCAVLLVSIIWYGIKIVRKSIDNPEAKADAKKGLVRVKDGVLILIGTLLFMALCIFGTNAICKSITKADTYELPIRVDVEGLYSFSTTPTGYARYMAQTEDLDEILQKIGYTFVYGLLMIINVAIIVIMIIRMFMLWFLSIIGPAFAMLKVLKRNENVQLRNWGGKYLFLSSIQIYVSAIYMVILYAIF